jgi:hypothetical protein
MNFLEVIGLLPQTMDQSSKLLDVKTRQGSLREIGFVDMDCAWKRLELALIIGFTP